jgi:rubrerythrin
MMELEGSRTDKNILTVFAGESQARNRYSSFSSQAKKPEDRPLPAWSSPRADFETEG